MGALAFAVPRLRARRRHACPGSVPAPCREALSRAVSEAAEEPLDLAACWGEALDAAENALAAVALTRTLSPAELAHWRGRLWRERDWLRRQLALGQLPVLAAAGRCLTDELSRRTTQSKSALAPMVRCVRRATMATGNEGGQHEKDPDRHRRLGVRR